MIGLVGRGLVLSLLLSCSPGCELVAGVDRRRIPDDRELRCGDGLVFPSLGEGCDDRNLTNGDGCDTDCQVEPGFQCDRGQPSTCVTVCGDGLVRGDEECDDGNTISWDGCDPDCRLEHGFECSGEPTKCTSTCGDGLLAGFEGCDDGNGASGDGCDASCEVEPGWSCAGEPSTCVKIVAPSCGDGVIDAGEGCDDGDTISGDGCSADCAVESGHACAGEPSVCDTVCGDGILVGDEACDDGNTMSDDGCSAACVVESGYACAGQPSACSAVCGDGIVAGAEECDDANLVSLDGCSADCRIDVFSEAEPNDGTAAANGPFDHPVAIRGSNKPGTDVDVFAIALTATTDLGVETFDESGAGSCANIDTVVTVLGTDGATVLASDDDAGINACSRLDSARTAALRHLPAGTYFVKVEAYDHYRPIPGYRLEVRFDAVCGDGIEQGAEECDGSAGCTATCDRTPVCGDGFVDAPEICDDGNGASGDGCSATCQYEILGEVEPNDTAAGAPHAPPALLGGALSSASDVDTFAISLPFTADLRLETFDASGPASCAGIDTVLTLIDVDGVTTLLSRDQGGVGNCARIDPARPSDRAAAHLPAGTYHVAVTGHGAPIAGYTLLATFAARCGDGVIEGAEECDGSAGCAGTCDRIAVCGDALVDAPETCDDGNGASGDGCSAACQLELVMESEPNGTTASANGPFGAHALIQGAIAPAGDADVFAMELAAVSDVRIEVFDGSGPGSCDGVDTVATLFAEDGVTVLAKQDDGGIASCSRIDPKIDAGARHLAAGTYYVQIESFLPSTPIPAYRLEVSFPAVCGDGVVQGAEECDGTPNCTATCERVPTCGDGFVDAPETCDDGNGASGDGCSATCAVEAIGEVEPNDGAAAADAAPLAITGSAVIAGAIGAVGDVDVFRIDLASPAVATLETLDPSGDSCSIATTLRLRDAAFAELWADDNSGMASCSALVVPLTSGTHYVSVEQQGNTSIIAGYLLSVRIAGDGGAEIEPNETLAAATPLSGTDVVVSGDHAANGDVDFYAVTLPAGRSLRAEIIEGSAAETCESLDIDSALTLYDAAGVAIASDDDAGRGFCSRIDGSGALLGGTHYLAVEAAPFAQTPGDSAGQFSYRLVVRVF